MSCRCNRLRTMPPRSLRWFSQEFKFVYREEGVKTFVQHSLNFTLTRKFTVIGARTSVGGRDRSARTELESNWKQSCKLLSEAGSSRSLSTMRDQSPFVLAEGTRRAVKFITGPRRHFRSPVEIFAPSVANHFPKAPGPANEKGTRDEGKERERERREWKKWDLLLEMHGRRRADDRRGPERLARSHALEISARRPSWT